ncbi:MAG: archease [Promethearchaeota archaeon]|nr:MAG: archease [Candidatus Lokiarchaeota archaeon]
MAGYRFLEHTADVYIEAEGNSLEAAFEQASLALYDTLTDVKLIEPSRKQPLRIEAEDLQSLLFELINEFLYLFDTEQLLFSQFKWVIQQVQGGYLLEGDCWGETFQVEKHPPRTEIKAPTYHLMEIIQNPSNVILRFVVDI